MSGLVPGVLKGPEGLSKDTAPGFCSHVVAISPYRVLPVPLLGPLQLSERGSLLWLGLGITGSLFCSWESLCPLWIDTLRLMKINTCFKASPCSGAAVFLPTAVTAVSSPLPSNPRGIEMRMVLTLGLAQPCLWLALWLPEAPSPCCQSPLAAEGAL